MWRRLRPFCCTNCRADAAHHSRAEVRSSLRIHLQSYPGTANFPLTQEVWDEAAARWPDLSAGHQLSFGNTRESFEAGMRDAEMLIAQTSSLVGGAPPAPRLKLVYVASAGLGKRAP